MSLICKTGETRRETDQEEVFGALLKFLSFFLGGSVDTQPASSALCLLLLEPANVAGSSEVVAIVLTLARLGGPPAGPFLPPLPLLLLQGRTCLAKVEAELENRLKFQKTTPQMDTVGDNSRQMRALQEEIKGLKAA